MRRAAIDLAQPGDVVVVAAGGGKERSCFGGVTAAHMQTRGIAGVLVDGMVRDLAELRRIAFPTVTRGTTPLNFDYPAGREDGAVNVPVDIDGVRITPGDVVVGDEDGTVIVPRDRVAAVIAKAQALEERLLRCGWTGSRCRRIRCVVRTAWARTSRAVVKEVAVASSRAVSVRARSWEQYTPGPTWVPGRNPVCSSSQPALARRVPSGLVCTGPPAARIAVAWARGTTGLRRTEPAWRASGPSAGRVRPRLRRSVRTAWAASASGGRAPRRTASASASCW